MISEKKTVCLNMIVKNESHIIEKTLNNLCDKINFDYYVICDTGSTDNTKETITNFFNTKNIKGEIFDDIWQDFGYNRTKALEYAFNKTDYAIIFDADDEICGDFKLPDILDKDGYHFQFGNENGTSYTRVQMINNRIGWKYVGVLHEFIDCLKPNPNIEVITGNYYTCSGRSGNRNKDPNKYLKDALILEKAHAEAFKNDDKLYLRYAFYCANSYSDCGKYDKAIEWYKITLTQDNWYQEKYNSCKSIYNCFCILGRKEEGLYYLVESFKYDDTRGECLYHLITEYLWKDMPNVAYNFYLNSKKYIENEYLTSDNSHQLFVDVDKLAFMIPYYMILVADKVKEFKTVAKMYEIIFIKKCHMFNEHWIGNMLFNLQFFMDYCIEYIPNFMEIMNEYFDFLNENNFNYNKFRFLSKFKDYGLNIDYSEFELKQYFKKEECQKSNKVLFYTGYSDSLWNYTISLNKALGGSETAVTYIAQYLPKNYDIYIAGDVEEEKFDNITYIHNDRLSEFLEKNPIHTIIISRYASFLEIYKHASAYQIYIWAHDTCLLPYGCGLKSEEIVDKYIDKITGCICLTEWQQNLYNSKYPQLKNKIHLINNGLNLELFKYNIKNKKPNKFIYSSCSERGLSIILRLWPQIMEYMPDAELVISSYNKFPKDKEDEIMKKIIDSYDNIRHLGKLKREELYKEMSTAEYWFFPSIFPETSCITALEMLMSEVICVYYPFAGLPDTMKNFGIQMTDGNELDKLLGISIKDKVNLKKNGRKYAEECSWENRAKLWNELLCLNLEENNNEVEVINDADNKNDIIFEEKKVIEKKVEEINTDISDIQREIVIESVTESVPEKKEYIDVDELVKENIKKNDENSLEKFKKWVFYCKPCSFLFCVIDDYFDSLKTKYNVQYTEDRDKLFYIQPDMITFVNEIDSDIKNSDFLSLLKQTKVSYLNLEPLNLSIRLNNLLNSINILNKLDINFTIMDYSLSNINILNNLNIKNTIHLPYVIYNEENNLLEVLNKNTEKIYDFGIITGCGSSNSKSINDLTIKRKNVVNKLIDSGFSVNIISGWKYNRDKEIAKCKVLLNIHGQLPQPGADWQESKIFEHIRCDRLLNSGYNILSEESLHLSNEFTHKFNDNLKIIKYEDFFKLNINKLNYLWPNQFELNKYNNLNNPKKIIDCFTFYNEIDILIYRLNILDKFVDYFILVEATLTHVGKDKILFFDQIKNNPEIQKFKDKIIHIVVDDFPYNNINIDVTKEQQWKNEKYQRNCIKRGIEKLSKNLNDRDLLIIADVDEIPDPSTLIELKYSPKIIELNSLEQDFYYYNLNSMREEKWYHSKVISYKKYNELNIGCDDIRFRGCDRIQYGGWHLSYFGTPDFIQNKLLNFAHQEYNKSEITNKSSIEDKINKCKDLFNRGTNMKFIGATDNIYLPPHYEIYLKNYYKNNLDENNNIIYSQIEKKEIYKSNNDYKKYCFIHSCNLDNDLSRLEYLIYKLKSTGCYNVLENIYIINIGNPISIDDLKEIEISSNNNKIIINNYSTDISLLENCTINEILKFSLQHQNSSILYIHTKGVCYKEGHHFYENVNDWIDMMLYFLLEKHDLCLKLLNNGYDTIGCNYSNYYENGNEITPPHYSGNFWWANTNYIKQLNKLDDIPNTSQLWYKNQGEFWLLRKRTQTNYYVLHNSNVNHYTSTYKKEKYILNSE